MGRKISDIRELSWQASWLLHGSLRPRVKVRKEREGQTGQPLIYTIWSERSFNVSSKIKSSKV